MNLHVFPSKIGGEIAVSGSKSHTIRGIAAALSARGRCVLRAPLESADTRSTLEAAKRFGAKVAEFSDRWEIDGTGGVFSLPGGVIDMMNSGTGLRMLTGLAALQNFEIAFDGDDSLRTRPMKGLLSALGELGVQSSSTGGKAPFSLRGPVRSGCAKVDGTGSQFLTSLLFALPQAEGEFELKLDFLNERPYVGITLDWLARLGIEVEGSADLLRWKIRGGQKFPPFERTIPADFSTAAFPLAAAALAGTGVVIRNLDFNDAQGDKAVFGFFERMGAKLEYGKELTVAGGSPLHGGIFDLNATPDALPVMAAAAAFCTGETRLLNVAQARIKETDRIAVMALELRKMGVEISELPDGLVIRGGRVHGSDSLESHGDHRIAMALAVAALAADTPSVIHDAEAAQVSYPGFIADFKLLGACFQ